MIVALVLTCAACTILLLATLCGLDRHLTSEVPSPPRKRAPSTLGSAQRGHGLLVSGFELLMACGLAVRPPPVLSI
jgi:hypothetical protein